MSGRRVHLFGPSGAGTTTLGRALAQTLAIPHFDTDDFYWAPTPEPFCVKRPVEERLRLMQEMFLPRADWVLSGALESWGGPIVPRFTLAVRLTLDPAAREARLRAREERRGPLTEAKRGFLSWARGYEAGIRPGRSLSRHLAFAETLACPVLVLDGARPVDDLTAEILGAL